MPKKKKVKKNIQTGMAHIQATFNNTVITITDVGGDAIAWSTAGPQLPREKSSECAVLQ